MLLFCSVLFCFMTSARWTCEGTDVLYRPVLTRPVIFTLVSARRFELEQAGTEEAAAAAAECSV